ncbi:MAG: sigma-70 family RNA polymerase sigma factor, partial [Planctomycetes bacterium]|nr:sigma-70 family RNA polymerase sigma factor [Planctomycetota bacterium]
ILTVYRREVATIPHMDRAEELQFIMGIELLWRRLKAARRAAGFSQEEVERYPGTDDLRCGTCPPGRQRVCMGCAPIELDSELRARLRDRTQEFVAARNELMERHLGIVFRLLQRYRYTGVPIEDLIQEANYSLFKAVQGFDFTRGFRFKTYAGYWVNQAFLAAIYNQSRTVRVPAYIQKAMKKIHDASNGRSFGTENVDAIAESSGVPIDLVRSALVGNRFTLSLNKTVDEDGSEMIDLVEDVNASVNPDFNEQALLSGHLQEAVERLTEREQRVLKQRFGLSGEPPRTLAEVGAELGISLERVRQIQKAALDKIRTGEEGKLLAQYA